MARNVAKAVMARGTYDAEMPRDATRGHGGKLACGDTAHQNQETQPTKDLTMSLSGF